MAISLASLLWMLHAASMQAFCSRFSLTTLDKNQKELKPGMILHLPWWHHNIECTPKVIRHEIFICVIADSLRKDKTKSKGLMNSAIQKYILWCYVQQILLCITIYTLPKQVENACTVFLWLNSIWWILVCCLSRVRERTIHNGLEDHRRASRAILTSSLWRGKNFVHLILIVVGHRRSIFNDENFTIYRYI